MTSIAHPPGYPMPSDSVLSFITCPHPNTETHSACPVLRSFAGQLNHHARTYLNGVIGMAQVLQGTELTAEQQDYLQTLLDSADGLLSLCEDSIGHLAQLTTAPAPDPAGAARL